MRGALTAASAARVSLVVRSMGRPELAEALASVAAQDHPDLEVVIVDATGGAHPPLPSVATGLRVRFVAGTERRRRPVAANAGLDATTGDYLGFLDDDDTLLPGHVAGLAHALDVDPAADLVFAMVREVRSDGDVRRVGNARLTRLVLLEDCFFPPCAALFRRSVLGACRFDESLDAAEDWDFWLQLSRHATFRFVPQETAVYRADRGRSSMSTGTPDGERWRTAVREKWAGERAELAGRLDVAFDAALAAGARGDYAAAERAAGEALALHPYHVGALNVRGTCSALRGDFVAADRDFRDAVEIDPADIASTFNLAQAEAALRHAEQARALYRRVLVLDPAHAQARARLDALDRQTTRQPRP